MGWLVKKRITLLREYSVPLLAGVALAMLWANAAPDSYRDFLHGRVGGGLGVEFLANDVFMVFFFALAAVEITRSFLPGGALHSLKHAVNTLIATAGGVVGPAFVYLALNTVIGAPELQPGWGIPTATDIAFAWLAARMIFGSSHPAVSFLLLLAVADDAIGLVIIAVFYPDPHLTIAPMWLLMTGAGIVAAYILRVLRVRSYWPYILAGGILSWTGLYRAHVHPALALVCIVPFLPTAAGEQKPFSGARREDHSTLEQFELDWKVLVDFGLFFFGLVNAGVAIAAFGSATWLVLAALLIGKPAGILFFGDLAVRLGYPLPPGVGKKELFIIGIIAGFGFTVALFMAGEAFPNPLHQDAAKMGAIMSVGAAVLAAVSARFLGVPGDTRRS